jgi:RNA polymerase sigma-70 factor (ECF subfamily)
MDRNFKKEFEHIYEENADALFRFIRFRVSDRQQAIDIAQESFIKFWQVFTEQEVKEERAFLFKIARNLVIDWYRKSKSVPMQNFSGEVGDEEVSLDMFSSNIVSAETSSEVEIAKKEIAGLEPIYREAVYLRYVEELTPKEIAEILGESTNVISVRINRGVALLQSKFKQ